MRIATGILSFFFAIFTFYEGNNAPAPDLSNEMNESFSSFTSLLGVLMLIGVAFVFTKPNLSRIAFGVAGIIGIGAGSTSVVPHELISYGVVSLIFALMSHRAMKEVTKQPARNIEQDIDQLRDEISRLKAENDELKRS